MVGLEFGMQNRKERHITFSISGWFFSLAAMTVSIDMTRSASLTDSVPDAEDFLPAQKENVNYKARKTSQETC